MTGQHRRRLLYIISYLKNGDAKAAAKDSGLKGQHARERLAKHLETYGTLEESPHPSPPTKFTPIVLEAATDYVVENDDRPIGTTEIVRYLEGAHYLEPPTNNHNFLQHWREWLAEQGLTLTVGTSAMIFKIDPENMKKRMKWAQQMSRELGSVLKLEDMIFEDETSFEESPHPKGTARKMLLRNLTLPLCCRAWLS